MILARVADSFYWMNRYLERVAHTARLLELQLERLPSSPAQDIAAGWRRIFHSLGTRPPGADIYGGTEDEDAFLFADGYTLTDYLSFEAANSASVIFCLTAARENARQVRDSISNAVWSSLNREYLRLRATSLVDVWDREPVMLYRGIVEAVQLFDGVCASAMRRDAGWHFMRVGRFIERAQLVASLIGTHHVAAEDSTEGEDDWTGLLQGCHAFETYCHMHGAQLRGGEVISFLVSDPELPYSLRFAVDRLCGSLEVIDPPVRGRSPTEPHDIAGRLDAILSRHTPIDLTASGRGGKDIADFMDLCRKFHEALERTYVYYPTEARPAVRMSGERNW